jgi:hypothetical protein
MTDPQKSAAEIKVEWDRRRRRQTKWRWSIGTVLLLLLLGIFVPAAITGKPGVSLLLVAIIIELGLCVLSLGFMFWNRRCPACGRQPGGTFQRMWRFKECKNCGAQLRD